MSDKKDSFLKKDDIEESTQLINEKDQKNNINKCKCSLTCLTDKVRSIGVEFWFALTFVGRIIMTLYSFHGLFFIYNFIIQFILLIPSRLYDMDSLALQIIFGIFYILFSSAASNVLVIPTYDFFLFPFLNFVNPLAHLHSIVRAKYVMNDEKDKLKREGNDQEIENKNIPIMNFLLIIISLFYVIGLAISLLFDTKLKDYAKLIVLTLIYIYYTLLLFGYILISGYIVIKLTIFSCKRNKGCYNALINIFSLNEYFGDPDKELVIIIEENEEKKNEENNIEENKIENINNNVSQENKRDLPPLPRLNLLRYVIHPILLKSYKTEERNANTEKNHCEDWCLDFKVIYRIVLFLYALLLVIIDLFNDKSKKDILPLFSFIIFYIIMLLLSIVLNFPICCRNKKTFGIGGFFTGKVKMKAEYKMLHPNLISFIRLMCNVIITLSAIILFAVFYAFKDSNTLKDLYDLTLDKKKNLIDSTSLLLPNVCFSSIHHIPIYLFMPFINDAYYYNDQTSDYEHYYHSSLQIPSYRDFFFDDTYKIDKIKSLINSTEGETVKMIQYNVRKRTDKENYITILSIKGTTNKKDAFIDFQLYFPSILLNLLSTFSIQGQQKETYSFKFIEYSLSVPYRLFFQYALVQSYLEALKKAYIENFDSFNKNIIIVGHSLGGGLAKLLGRLLNKQAISLSGPGVNAFHSLWGYEGNSENFELSAIDLVPDKDLVPRVEISGGTRYRIVCKEGPFGCHSKAVSLCEVLIMCRNPNYYTYCSLIAGLDDKKIKSLYESSEMNYNMEE